MCTAFNWFILTLQVFITVGPPFWYVKGVPACSGVPLLSCLHTIRIRLTLLSSVEVGQQVAGTALQVRAGEVEVKVSEELMQTLVVGRAPEVLRVLVQPRAQDGRNSAETHRK